MDALSKKLDKQNKDLKAKLVLTENLALKRLQETDALRAKLEKKLQEEEKWLVRDKQ
jgi:DNA recombination-dependent growth factor C